MTDQPDQQPPEVMHLGGMSSLSVDRLAGGGVRITWADLEGHWFRLDMDAVKAAWLTKSLVAAGWLALPFPAPEEARA